MLLVIGVLVVACGSKPKNLIKEDAMVALLTDAYRLEGFYAVEHNIENFDADTSVLATYDALFKAHGVTREDFDVSMEYYMRHYNKYEAIHKRVIANLDEEQNNL